MSIFAIILQDSQSQMSGSSKKNYSLFLNLNFYGLNLSTRFVRDKVMFFSGI